MRRVLQSIPTLLIIMIATFALVHLAPGGPFAYLVLNPHINRSEVLRLEAAYGLNLPLPIQFIHWFWAMVHLNFGISFQGGQQVATLIGAALPNTLLLVGISLCIILLISFPIGILAAVKQYSVADYTATILSFGGISIPDFWLGLMLMIVFSISLNWLPAGGMLTIGAPFSIWDRIRYLILPVTTYVLVNQAYFSRYIRSSMLEVVRQDYIRTARSKGVRERVVIYKHALRNAMIPVATIFGLTILPSLVGGAVILETVFAWPGMGRLYYQSAVSRDYPTILAITLIAAFAVILGNLLADLSYGLLDPRVQYD